MKILTVIGARPQIIKSAIVGKQLDRCGVTEVVVHTGQHYDDNMSDMFFRELGIDKPKYNLDVNGTAKYESVGAMMIKIGKVIEWEHPDYVLTYGDTDSTLAGAMAAKKCGVRLIHVEAGVRYGDMHMQEEINRVVTDQVSDILFCPTTNSLRNLVMENTHGEAFITGDVMYDAAMCYQDHYKGGIPKENYVYVTVHRAENVDDYDRLKKIVDFINYLGHVVFPVHPRTYKMLKKYNLHVPTIMPVGYFASLALTQNSTCVVTDSGGLVREAYFFGKKSLFLLPDPVWPELEGASVNTDVDNLKDNYCKMLLMEGKFINIFGNGRAAEKIAEHICRGSYT